MSSEWHKIFSPPSEKMTIAPGLQVSAIIAKADAIIAEAQRKSATIFAEVLRQVAAAIAEAKFAAAMAQVARLN